MELAFETKINGQPTQFVEKIWQGLLTSGLEFNLKDFSSYLIKVPGLAEYVIGDLPAKLHTILKDEKDSWKANSDIQMVIHKGTSKQLQFAPVLKCVSTQPIRIDDFKDQDDSGIVGYRVYIGKAQKELGWCWIKSGKVLSCDKVIYELVMHNGFDSVVSFFQHFNEDFTSLKIIHWTSKNYGS